MNFAYYGFISPSRNPVGTQLVTKDPYLIRTFSTPSPYYKPKVFSEKLRFLIWLSLCFGRHPHPLQREVLIGFQMGTFNNLVR